MPIQSGLESIIGLTSRCVVVASAHERDYGIVFVNQAFTMQTGYESREVIGRNCRFLQGPNTNPTTVANIRKALSSGQSVHCEILNYRKDGQTFWNDLTIDPVLDERGVITHFVSIQHDASIRHHAVEDLAVAQRRLNELLEHVPGYVYRRELLDNGQISYPFLSPSIFRILGLPADTDWSGDQLIENIHPSDRATARESIIESSRTLDVIRSEFRITPFPGREHWFRSQSQPRLMIDGTVAWEGIAVDITAEKQAEQLLHHMASHDSLTDLPNKLQLRTILLNLILSAIQKRASIALFLINVVNLKPINEELGPMGGDQALRDLAAKLRTYALAYGGCAARNGGDEFALAVPVSNSDFSLTEQTKALYQLTRGSPTTHNDVAVDCRVGSAIVGLPDDVIHLTAEDWVVEMLKRADLALHQASLPGACAWRVYSTSLDDRSDQRTVLRRSLRNALAQEQFELHYQPQFDLRSGKLVGAEALLRWRHPKLGFQSPDAFIPYAESSGLIVPIGAWVLREAMRQVACWIADGLRPPKIAINVSAVQLRSPEFKTVILKSLESFAVQATDFELEITEGTLVDPSSSLPEQLSFSS